MRSHRGVYETFTTGEWDFVDITDGVQEIVAGSGIDGGHVTVLSRSPDCALIVNERESGLLADIRDAAAASGHPGSLLGTRSVVLPAAGARLMLGGWQRIMLVELGDQPNTRCVDVQIVGD